MRLFAQLGWYFRREWQRYLGAVALLIIIAILQLIPPKVVGIVVDGVTQKQFTHQQVWMWVAALVAIAEDRPTPIADDYRPVLEQWSLRA